MTPQVDMIRHVPTNRTYPSLPIRAVPIGDWTYVRFHGTGPSDANERFMKLMHPLLDM